MQAKAIVYTSTTVGVHIAHFQFLPAIIELLHGKQRFNVVYIQKPKCLNIIINFKCPMGHSVSNHREIVGSPLGFRRNLVCL